MSHVRTALRTAVRGALETALPGITWRAAWWHRPSADALPRGGVATPKTRTRRIDTDDVEATVDLVVMVRRHLSDADLEDALDDDEAAIAAALSPVLASVSDDFEAVETDISVSAEADQFVGDISILFRVVLRHPHLQPAEP